MNYMLPLQKLATITFVNTSLTWHAQQLWAINNSMTSSAMAWRCHILDSRHHI